jgi:hypothetical protein
MKTIIAIAAGLLLAGQSTFAFAAANAPNAHVRAVNQCVVQQRKLVKSDQARVRANNRCDLALGQPKVWSLPVYVGLGLVAAGVGIYEATKSTSP